MEDKSLEVFFQNFNQAETISKAVIKLTKLFEQLELEVEKQNKKLKKVSKL